MANTSSIFAGNSRYSQDFQSVIDRSVAIASLSLVQYRSIQSQLQEKSAAMRKLDDLVTKVDGAVKSLESGLGMASFSASASDPDAATVSISSGVYAGSYSLEVVSLGARTLRNSTATATSLTSNISSSLQFRLTVGDTSEELTLSSNTIGALADAINASGLAVQATIVNTGTSTSPAYQLSLQASQYGAVDVALEENSGGTWNHLLPAIGGLGSDVRYKVNGSGEITSDSRSLSFSPGLTVNLDEPADGATLTISVSRTTTAIQNAVNAFVLAYNDVITEVDTHRGEEGGILTGDPLLYSITSALRTVTQYSDTAGSIGSLTSLGQTFDDDGKLSFDSSTFAAAVDGDFEKLRTFLGTSSGSGFLKAATDALNALRDSDSGAIGTALSSIDDQIEAQDDTITAETDRIELLRESLMARMVAADALIASMEQQVLYFSDMFESMRAARN